MVLTGGHWASLSAATSWTLRCLVWDFPLVLISLVNTYNNSGEEEEEIKEAEKENKKFRVAAGNLQDHDTLGYIYSTKYWESWETVSPKEDAANY